MAGMLGGAFDSPVSLVPIHHKNRRKSLVTSTSSHPYALEGARRKSIAECRDRKTATEIFLGRPTRADPAGKATAQTAAAGDAGEAVETQGTKAGCTALAAESAAAKTAASGSAAASATVQVDLHAKARRDHDLDDLELQVVRYKPEGLEALCKTTQFSRKEIQLMYRGFKQECPTGIVDKETFKEIYQQFFPQGSKYRNNSSQYATYVFNTFDQDRNGSISFEEFVVGLSVLSRGSLQEKLQWAFTLYDINNDGYITRDEMFDIVSAIYDMMGRFANPPTEDHTAQDHVERVFQKMDLNQDGVITMDEFMDSCTNDEIIPQSMSMFDTQWY